MFSMIVPASGHKYGVDDDTMRSVLMQGAERYAWGEISNDEFIVVDEIGVGYIDETDDNL